MGNYMLSKTFMITIDISKTNGATSNITFINSIF